MCVCVGCCVQVYVCLTVFDSLIGFCYDIMVDSLGWALCLYVCACVCVCVCVYVYV